jgi:DNA polymerase I
MSGKLQREAAAKARDIYERCGVEFNINSPKQLGDVLFNKLALPMPAKYGKGKKISTAVDVLEGLAAEHEVPRLVLEYRQLTKLKSTYVDALPALIRSQSGRVHTTFGQTGTATGQTVVGESKPAEYPDSHRTRARDSRGLYRRAGARTAGGRLFADRVAPAWRITRKTNLLVEAFRRGDDIHTLTASQVFGVPPLMVTPEHRRAAKVVNFGIVYGLSAFGCRSSLGIDDQRSKKIHRLRISKNMRASAHSSMPRSNRRGAIRK